jgi:adenylate kinase
LETYQKKTAPLAGFYEKEGQLKNFESIDSKTTVEKIKAALQQE